MKLTDSAKYVLRNNGQHLFSSFWKEDVRTIFTDLKKEFKHFNKQNKSLNNVKGFSELPTRLKSGSILFKEKFIFEIDRIDDPKDKTIFCLKVIGALTAYVVNTMYEVRNSGSRTRFPNLKRENTFTRFLVSEMLLRLGFLFILRFIEEIETQMTDSGDLRKLRFLKKLITSGDYNPVKHDLKGTGDDKALQLVEFFRNYIMTGKES